MSEPTVFWNAETREVGVSTDHTRLMLPSGEIITPSVEDWRNWGPAVVSGQTPETMRIGTDPYSGQAILPWYGWPPPFLSEHQKSLYWETWKPYVAPSYAFAEGWGKWLAEQSCYGASEITGNDPGPLIHPMSTLNETVSQTRVRYRHRWINNVGIPFILCRARAASGAFFAAYPQDHRYTDMMRALENWGRNENPQTRKILQRMQPGECPYPFEIEASDPMNAYFALCVAQMAAIMPVDRCEYISELARAAKYAMLGGII
jgi:hypothetical protein